MSIDIKQTTPANDNQQTTSTSKPKRIEQWPLSRLKPHPMQAKLFGDPTEFEVKELADRITKEGMINEIEALPDGTIIAGHRRKRAAEHLKWTIVPVWVRDDLQEQGPAAVEARLIWDNLGRRQMGFLDMARCYKQLKMQARLNRTERLTDHQMRDLRDRIGKRVGISGRSLDRLLRIMNGTPQEVQDAVTNGKLPMTVAYDVAGLTQQQRDQIAREIRAGSHPREVVRKFLAQPRKSNKDPHGAKVVLVRSMVRGIRDLQGRVEQVPFIYPEDEEVFSDVIDLIAQLRERPRFVGTGLFSLSRDGEPNGNATSDTTEPAESPETAANGKKQRRGRQRRK